jgi:hypothetical protein
VNRERHPWSNEDCTALHDMVLDGYPAKAIAARLSRSVGAVIGMARKSGLKIQRGKTKAFQVQVDLAAYAKLSEIAKTRQVSPNTLAAKNTVFVDQLFDDADRHIEADDKPAVKPEPAIEPAPPPPASVSLSMLTAPVLDGRIGAHQI